MDTSQTDTLSLSQEASRLEKLKIQAKLLKSLEYSTFQHLCEICSIFNKTDPAIAEDWLFARETLFEILHSLFLTSALFERIGHFFLIDQLLEEGKINKLAKQLLQPSKIRVNIPPSSSRAGFINHYLNLAEELVGNAPSNPSLEAAGRNLVNSFNTMWHTLSRYIEQASEELSDSCDPNAFQDVLTSFAKDADLSSQYNIFASSWQNFAHNYLLSRL